MVSTDDDRRDRVESEAKAICQSLAGGVIVVDEVMWLPVEEGCLVVLKVDRTPATSAEPRELLTQVRDALQNIRGVKRVAVHIASRDA